MSAMNDDIVFRELSLDTARADDKQRAVPAALSSETPVERYFGLEVLSHQPDAVDLERARDGLPLLFSHNPDEIVGTVENIRLSGTRLRGRLRFGSSARAKEMWADVKTGIVRSLSVGYRILKMDQTGEQDGQKVFTATRWQPLEASLVAIPADPSVGVGRQSTLLRRGIPMNDNHDDVTGGDPVRAERDRVDDILALAGAHHQEDLGRRAVSEGWALDRFRGELLRTIGTPTPIAKGDPNIGLTQTEAAQFSFVRAIRAQMDPQYASREAGFELECSRSVARQLGRQPLGVFVPNEALSTRDLNVGTGSDGGYTVATDLLGFIELLRNQSKVILAGAQVLSGLVGDVAIPKQTGAATAYWVAEGGEPTESQQTFGQVALSPKTLGAFTELTRKILLQSSMDIEAMVRADLAAVLAIEIDRVAINGSGSSNQPQGILNTTGIGDVAGGANGLAPTYSHVVDLLSELANDNADQGNLGYLTNSKVRGKLLKTEKASSTGEFVWETGANGDGRLLGFNAMVSNQVPSDLDKGTSTGVCSAIIAGNWSDLVIGQWAALDLLVDPFSLSKSGGVRVTAFQDVDIAVRHPESFAAMLDALTS